jgi:molybdopterin converting factor small subunit
MSTYHILLFGICRDLLKSSTISIEKEGVITVKEMLETLRSMHPALENLPSLRLAAEHQFPEPDFILSATMEIALIPPVSGG